MIGNEKNLVEEESIEALREELKKELLKEIESEKHEKISLRDFKKRLKQIAAVIIAGVVLLTVGFLGGKLLSPGDSLPTVVDPINPEIFLKTLDSEIKEIGELATIEYIYTNAGKYDSPKQLFGKDIPFTTKSFVAKWDGTIKAGVDVEKVSTVVDYFGKKILVYLPEAEILSHEIDESSFETFDEKDGLFNRITVDDTKDFDEATKNEMEQRAIEIGLLEKATENAKIIIENFVFSNPGVKESYTIEFKAD